LDTTQKLHESGVFLCSYRQLVDTGGDPALHEISGSKPIVKL